jgi:hypothetical protein
MQDRKTALLGELRQNAAQIETFYGGLSDAQLALPVYGEGAQWNVRQVLAHLITIEKSMHWLFRDILGGGPGTPPDFDIERFNRTQPRKLDGLPLAELLARFKTVRAETLAIVQGMDEADLDRQGRHAFHGPGRLERFVSWAYEHAALHVADVRQALNA